MTDVYSLKSRVT